MAEPKVRARMVAEVDVALEPYDNIAFLTLATLEQFVSDVRAAGAPNDVDIQVCFRRVVDGEPWTGLRYRRRVSTEDRS